MTVIAGMASTERHQTINQTSQHIFEACNPPQVQHFRESTLKCRNGEFDTTHKDNSNASVITMTEHSET